MARRLSTLDHISGGRAAWNVVTSTKDAEARNFGSVELMEHGKRYERAEEFLRVVTGLWDGWEDDALVLIGKGRSLPIRHGFIGRTMKASTSGWKGP